MTPLTDNPFATLTIVVAPAILTNATSVLCLGTGNRIARVIFCIKDGEMILLHGFEKKTQKTPPQDIELARMRKREIDE